MTEPREAGTTGYVDPVRITGPAPLVLVVATPFRGASWTRRLFAVVGW